MTVKVIKNTPLAYPYPLLIKNILSAPLIHSSDQEIIYSNKSQYSYKTFSKRVACLANLLGELGIDAAVDVILAVARAVENDPSSIVELDINPLMLLAQGQGVVAADALISLNLNRLNPKPANGQAK